MAPNRFLGVIFHWLGGLAAGSFYVPYRGVKRWSWETYWLVGGVFSWILAPSALALVLTNDLAGVLARAPGPALFWAWFFGLLWGLGGLTFGLTMHIRNRTAGENLARASTSGEPVPRRRNLFFCALAGLTWYLQFFFYTMGETQMGRYSFSSWTLHMASIIIFSTLWGVALKEWRGTSPRTHRLIAAGIVVLIVSTLVVGYGNYLAAGAAS